MATKQLSREGYEKLLQELQELKKVKLPAVLENLAEAKAMGDLSENFDYKSALEEKDLVHSRIKEIEELIEDVEIVDADKKKGDKVVNFGSKVTVQIENDKPYDVIIVGTGEVSIKDEVSVSFDSPLGQAIRGKKVGEIAKMRLANARKDVKVLAIK
ncbi:MAG: transcription elongation factor GreA [Candidatus Absconditabacteria bacterium]|nr:transcription elongation factor GreA [Candidatus Absconditabacteria bacterium]MDD3868578.1 transcription elongation factor GreA [Candidatus Absconditabacteria bacterium]MDD4714753.1 transcription elongation factor GreA [Candidatus Absconditabacteria bacterium]